jgi:hypothetical protein
MRQKILWVAAVVMAVWVALTVVVERETTYKLEHLSEDGSRRALVLYHPSREAKFSDDLSLAIAAGLHAAGFTVDRATITGQTPARPEGYDFLAVVSNTYNWAPDWPTTRYLKRARLRGIAAVGVIGGAGSTERSERILGEALRGTGADVFGTHSFWLWRPNDKTRLDEPNRKVGLEMARRFAADAASRT